MKKRAVALTLVSVAIVTWMIDARGQDSKPSTPGRLGVAASMPASGERRPVIEGRVTDPAAQPIPGALIEWGFVYDPPDKLQRTTTDESGRFRLELVDYGVSFVLTASAPGRSPGFVVPFPGWNLSVRDVPCDIKAVPPKTVDFELQKEHRVLGIVVDEQGEPIEGVQVTARTMSEGEATSFSSPAPPLRIPGATATTDAKGRFRLSGLPADQVRLRVESPHRHVNEGNYPVDRKCRIVMTGSGQAGVLRVRVVDNQTGKPVPTFTVLRRYDPKPRTFNTPDGRFEWADVTAGGQYSLHIYSKEHAPAALQAFGWPVEAEEEETAELLPGQPFLGRLIEARTGKPISGVPVLYGIRDGERTDYFEWPDRETYVDGHHRLSGVQRAVTDDEGKFWFSETDDGPQGTLFVLAEGYGRLIVPPEERPPQSAEDGHVGIELHPEATISGVLLNAQAVHADAVSVWKLQPRIGPEESFESCPLDADGRYRIRGLGPGTYLVSYQMRPSRVVRTSERFATVTLARGEHKVLEAKTINPTP